MSAVPKPGVIPIRTVEPDPNEPPFTPIDEMMTPPHWGPHDHSEADLRAMWSRIYRCFKSRRLCEGFLLNNKSFSLDVWAAAFEEVRQRMDGKFEIIGYVCKVAGSYVVKGTPAENAAKELAAIERAKKAMNPTYAVVDPEDPDVKSFRERNNKVPTEDMANHPLTLKFKKMSRGEK